MRCEHATKTNENTKQTVDSKCRKRSRAILNKTWKHRLLTKYVNLHSQQLANGPNIVECYCLSKILQEQITNNSSDASFDLHSFKK